MFLAKLIPLTNRQSRRRVARHRVGLESLESRQLLTASPYIVPTAAGVEVTPILNAGDTVGGYTMAGIPDGMGAFDNNDGTFTVLMNHEIRNTLGVTRDHGSKGAFVSRWVIDKSTLEVLEGDDLIKQVYLWNTTTDSFDAATTAFNRLCSADLPDATAFYNAASGKGTTERIFMNGEETSNGRAFAHIVTGDGRRHELGTPLDRQIRLGEPCRQPVCPGQDDCHGAGRLQPLLLRGT